MTRLALLLLLGLAGCIGPPDHLIVSGTHDEFNDSYKETAALSFPITYGHEPPRPLEFWTPTR